jgi:class 3 adenylate cyclase/tetratricopeptide (TPR) repeat protein
MNCPRCQHENEADAKFCEECAAPLARACAKCGRQLSLTAKFCPECAHPVAGAVSKQRFVSPEAYTPQHLAEKILTSKTALEGERKQVTVLFCDVVNSTPLAEFLGAERMHSVLDRFFGVALAEVHRYEGTINQFLGDGFMALFGAPVAHEDHPRRATLAALAIRRALGDSRADLGLPEGVKLTVRMGLNTGPVVVGKIGDNLRMDYTAVGDTTNLAARLQQHAEPSQILISDATSRLVKGYVRFEALAPFQAKGKAEPVAAFKIVGLGTRRSRVDIQEGRVLSELVGRDRELGILRDVLGEVEASRGQVVGIVGEPGVGKSRLLYEFRRRLEGRSVTYLEGRCLSYGGAMPYLPLQDIIRDNCGISDSDTPGEIGEKLSAALEQVGMNPEEGAPYLLQLLGVKEGAERLAQIGPETIKARIFHTLQQMSLNGAHQRPVIVAVEDLHWIDKTSEEYFALVGEGLAGAPILLLTTYRPGYKPPWIDKSYVTLVALRPLSSQDSLRVVESVLERTIALSEPTTQVIIAKGEGNPFFLEELTRVALEGRLQGTSVAIPDTIQGVLAARVDRLPEEPKRVLQTAAVLGREFTVRLLRAISQDARDLEGDLVELKRLEFLYERVAAEGPVYVFKHALTQDVAYESLLTARRQTLHEAAGRAIEALYPDRAEEHYELLARHYSQSSNADKALEYLELANQKAAKANAMAEAKVYFEEAARRLSGPHQTPANQWRRIALMAKQWDVFQQLLAFSEYYELVKHEESIVSGNSDPAMRGTFYACLGHCQYFAGDYDEAIDSASKAVSLSEEAGNVDEATRAYMILEWCHFWQGNFGQALAMRDEVVRMTDRRFNLRFYAYAQGGASLASAYLGRWQQAVDAGEEELSAATRFSDDSLVSFASWNIAVAYTLQGDSRRALEHAQLAVRKAPTLADRAWSQAWAAWCECRAGQARKGVDVLAALLPAYRAARFLGPLATVMLFLGEGYLLAADHQQAQEILTELIQLAERSQMKFHLGSAYRLLGEIALRHHSVSVGTSIAVPHFEKSIAILRAIGAENELALAYAGYGRLYKQQRRHAEASDYLSRALEIFERLGTLSEPDTVRAELAYLPEP